MSAGTATGLIEAFTGWWVRRDRKVESQLDALYERLGERYWRPMLQCIAAIALLMWWGSLLVASFYIHLSVLQILLTGLFVSACLVGTLAWIVLSTRRGVAAPIGAWVRAGRPAEAAAPAWKAAVNLPFVAVWRVALWRLLVGVAVPLGLFCRFALGTSWLTAISDALGLAAVLPPALALEYFQLELWMRPVKRHAAARTLPDLPLRTRASMRWRLLVAMTAIGDGAGVIASLLSAPTHVTLKLMLVTMPIAVGVAGALAFGLSMLFTETIVCPMDELVDATGRIGQGDLSARVPVQSADELGILTRSFNRMAADLQRGREQMVSAREEERRRLRRDLHDGLGPTLAALVMQLEVASDLLEHNPAAARKLIAELKSQSQEAVVDVRRLVYELRPPTLDELGLVGAIRENAQRLLGHGASNSPRLTLLAPDSLPPLPAAVEVAALRITQEALTNLVRHASASRCTIEIALNGMLELEVRDDGIGIRDGASTGVGLASMRERAVELGGSFAVESAAPQGTVVRARLPLPELA